MSNGANYNLISPSLSGNGTVSNLEPTPAIVRYATAPVANLIGSASETTAQYYRISPGSSNIYALYAEIDSTQVDLHGGFLKLIHYGSGDAIYGALRGTGLGIELASYFNGSRHFNATNQKQGAANPQVGTDFGNTTHFTSVWGDDGTGGSTTPANYGIFYAARSLGNSFRTMKQDPLASGAAEGRIEWSISEYNFTRDRFQIYNNGELRTLSALATVGQQAPFSAPIRLVSSWWNAGLPTDVSVKINNNLNYIGEAQLDISVGAVGSETLAASITPTGLVLPTTSIVQWANGVTVSTGGGSPEGAVAANPGSIYLSTAGVVYAKTTGSGNTGWVAK